MASKVFMLATVDGTEQLLRAMDVKGYSHCIAKDRQPYETFYSAGANWPITYAVFTGWTSKTKLQAAINKALDYKRWQNVNNIELYETLSSRKTLFQKVEGR
jgi:hypothetical protein